MSWSKIKNIDYIGRWYKLMFNLQGRDIFGAYHNMFPQMPEDPKAHYEMLNDERNKNLIVALHNNTNPSIEDLAKATGLETKDISERLAFFRTNGMKQIKIRKVA